jgi:hypothetical protein
MAWRKKLETFQKRFTPRHRRIVGGAVTAVWAIGVVVHPGQYLLALSIPGGHHFHERMAARAGR